MESTNAGAQTGRLGVAVAGGVVAWPLHPAGRL